MNRLTQAVIEVKDLSKVYRIGHERKGMKGTATLRDSLVEMAHKPVELITGHRLKKEEFWALKDINFEIQQGDVVGIIGRNGSGKSTLLKILSQIVEPTKGEIRMRGRVASLLEVGTGFHPELTGRENIFFNGAILGMKRKEIISKFDEIVAFSEVEQFLDTPVKFYSSGMYVRLAFAVAAHLEPDILIVDEVLAVGDAAFQKKSLGKMSGVAKEGKTVLFVSHGMNSVKHLCNKGLLLQNGRVAFSGSADETISRYSSEQSVRGDGTRWVNHSKITSDGFTPLSLSLVDSQGNLINQSVPNDENIFIQIKGVIHQEDPLLSLGISLSNDTGETIFWSYPNDTSSKLSVNFPAGGVEMICEIPANLLNEGSYRIELIGGLHFKEWYFEPGNTSPLIQISVKGNFTSTYWNEKRPGILAPKLKWSIK